MKIGFMILDVFTDRPFTGNQLAVVTDARGLETAAMQTIAREFNFSETTFVLPPENPAHSARVRIFTPHSEMPFAGHPTIGTAIALAQSSFAQSDTLVLEEGIGPIEVRIDRSAALIRATLRTTAAIEVPDLPLEPAAVALALGLERDEIEEVFAASLGIPFYFARLKSVEAVDRAQVERQTFNAIEPSGWALGIFFFAGPLSDGASIHARMSAPLEGIEEDPATGAAVAALVGFLGERAGQDLGLRVRQGVAMGRPSEILGRAFVEDGRLVAVTISGEACIVARGELDLAHLPGP